MMSLLSPLIISGAPRSGTSLLYNLFDGHPEVNWLGDEGFLFEYLDDLGDNSELFLKAIPRDTENLIKGLRDKQVMPPLEEPYQQSVERGSVSEVTIHWSWDEAAYRSVLGADGPHDIPSLWRILASACVSGLGQVQRRFACMKSPDFGKSAVSALRWCPDARSVIIVRDPLYSLDSLKRSRELRGEKLLSWPLMALQVERFLRLHEIIRKSDKKRLCVVRYETLVNDPEGVMRGVASWIGIDYDDCLLQPSMHGQFWPGISSFAPTEGIGDAPQRRGLQALSISEQEFVRRALSDFRDDFNYA
ncbi:sulfotransferase family protein [Roseobacter sp. HKCCD7870]|uniref:sulfotransferase family protein n=1 Tax=Roseobacter sp. HKCCD7870 TaxID=3120343 RepID=UPI0030ED226D